MKKLIILALVIGMGICCTLLKADSYVVNNSTKNVDWGIGRSSNSVDGISILPANKAVKIGTKDLNLTYWQYAFIVAHSGNQIIAGPVPLKDNTTYTYSADGKLTYQPTVTPPTNLYTQPLMPGTPAWFAQQKSQANK